MILGPCPGAKTKLLYFNTKEYRVVTGLLAGQNTLRKIGLTNNSLYKRCGTHDENSILIFCECEGLALLRYVYLDSFFLNPEDKRLSIGLSGTLAKKGSHELVLFYGAKMARF